jgi:3-(3-hydroxy-phenyl)propionate hydroxylase
VKLGGLINTRAAEAAVPGGLERIEPARMQSLKPLLGPGLASGASDLRGCVAPQPFLSDGTRLDDHVGYRFAALLKPDFLASLSRPLVERIRQKDIAVVTDQCPAICTWLDDNKVGGIMVRPDRYVLGAARSEQDMDSLIAAI